MNLPIINGKNRKLSEINGHRFVADLLYYEGPLLSVYRTERHKDFFYKWCDSDARFNRWLVFPIRRADFRSYLSRQLSLLSLVKNSEELLLLDVCSDEDEVRYNRLRVVTVSDLPANYLPTANSILDESLQPSALALLQQPAKHTLRIDGNWYLDDFGKFQGVYSQLYAFFYALRNLGRPSISHALKHSLTAYPWKGGFSAVNIFREVLEATPEFHQVRVHKLQYSSPGTIELELLEDVAQDIKGFIEFSSPDEKLNSLHKIYMQAEKFLNENDLRNISGKRNSEQISQLDPIIVQMMTTHLDSLSSALGLTQEVEKLRDLGAHELVLLKFFLAIFRRYRRLKEFHARDLITSL